MRQISLLVYCFLAISGTAATESRQQLRSELVYHERNHKEGRYKYGYAVRRGESQFHHQRSLDGAMYGCYGYVDPKGKLFITHYLADMAGYQLVNMASPDKKLIEKIQNRSSPEHPIDLHDLFPLECHEDGDIKMLQQTANEMQAYFSSQEAPSTPESRQAPPPVHRPDIGKPVDGNHVSEGDSTKDQLYAASDWHPSPRKAFRASVRGDSEDKTNTRVQGASHVARGNGRYQPNYIRSSPSKSTETTVSGLNENLMKSSTTNTVAQNSGDVIAEKTNKQDVADSVRRTTLGGSKNDNMDAQVLLTKGKSTEGTVYVVNENQKSSTTNTVAQNSGDAILIPEKTDEHHVVDAVQSKTLGGSKNYNKDAQILPTKSKSTEGTMSMVNENVVKSSTINTVAQNSGDDLMKSSTINTVAQNSGDAFVIPEMTDKQEVVHDVQSTSLGGRKNDNMDAQILRTKTASESKKYESPQVFVEKPDESQINLDGGEKLEEISKVQNIPVPIMMDVINSESSNDQDLSSSSIKDEDHIEQITEKADSGLSVLIVQTINNLQEKHVPAVELAGDEQEPTLSIEVTADAVQRSDDQTADVAESGNEVKATTQGVDENATEQTIKKDDSMSEILTVSKTDQLDASTIGITETDEIESPLKNLEQSVTEHGIEADSIHEDLLKSIPEISEQAGVAMVESQLPIEQKLEEDTPALEVTTVNINSSPVLPPSGVIGVRDEVKITPPPSTETSSKPSFEIVKSILVYEYTEDGDFTFTDPTKSSVNGEEKVTESAQQTTSQIPDKVRSVVVISNPAPETKDNAESVGERRESVTEILHPKVAVSSNGTVQGTHIESGAIFGLPKPDHMESFGERKDSVVENLHSKTVMASNAIVREALAHSIAKFDRTELLGEKRESGGAEILHTKIPMLLNGVGLGTITESSASFKLPKSDSTESAGERRESVSMAPLAANNIVLGSIAISGSEHKPLPVVSLPAFRVPNPVQKIADNSSPKRADKPFFNRHPIGEAKVTVTQSSMLTEKQTKASVDSGKTRKGSVSRGRVRYADYANGQKKATTGDDSKSVTRGEVRRTKVQDATISKAKEEQPKAVAQRVEVNKWQNTGIHIGQISNLVAKGEHGSAPKELPKTDIQKVEKNIVAEETEVKVISGEIGKNEIDSDSIRQTTEAKEHETVRQDLPQTDEMTKTVEGNDNKVITTENLLKTNEQEEEIIEAMEKVQNEPQISTSQVKSESVNRPESGETVVSGSRRIDIRKGDFRDYFVRKQEVSVITDAFKASQLEADSSGAHNDSLERAETDRSHLVEFAKTSLGPNTVETSSGVTKLGTIVVPEEYSLASSVVVNEVKNNDETKESVTEPSKNDLHSEPAPGTENRPVPVKIPEYVIGATVGKKLTLQDESSNLLTNQGKGTFKKLAIESDSVKSPIRLVIPLINHQDSSPQGIRKSSKLENTKLGTAEKVQSANAGDSMITRIVTLSKTPYPQGSETIADDIQNDQRAMSPKLPATPRTTTESDAEPTTVNYQLAIATDRIPVTPHPATLVRPVTSGYLLQATTPEIPSNRAGTTIGPNGDIYDEVEEDNETESRPAASSSTSTTPFPPLLGIGPGVTIQPSASCYEITLNIPIDAKQVLIRTDSAMFQVAGDGDPKERIKLIEPGVYEVNVGATSAINFKQYQGAYRKPLHADPINTPVPTRSTDSEDDETFSKNQQALLDLIPTWKKVLFYY
ncbi:uncharacterized protein LOC129768089 [Toxorhynchites rutilus septentrionalis]|uniref:uncharacterized protein LOC129768089 n=1 Tax=Toxorhynchites rutilus septentrionalis TaxID=329112 RepID=UPI00247A6FD0|nr:uncharacterized protein LOC129768089 [Toxorhynchites rutilus septentrionalis]